MTNAVVYHRPVASSFGERFEATMTNRQVEIGFGSKQFHFTMRSSRLRRSSRPMGHAAEERGGSMWWRVMGLVGCASLALGLLFVAGGMLKASPPAVDYAVVMPIDAKAMRTAPRAKAKERQIVRTKTIATPTPAPNIVDDWSVTPASDVEGVGTGIVRPDPDVATLPTINGERAVAVYGPSRSVDGKSCRDVSVFVRDMDGKVSVSPTTECKTAR
ncbi:MAG: hypothetical protein J0J06_14675 [Sphingomonas sp.]|uniref:hypothetical protein n=1 Tax=Sphingomonas sp. TaxID=28214 RepID=UPI001AD4D0A2|nr:hypothetical protein [Sphingomonas sp.]MBN8816679.1 hypothetical protein [Sphingomonas sp.]